MNTTKYKVGEVVTMPADEVLGTEAQEVEIIEVCSDGSYCVKELDAPEDEAFEVSNDLRCLFPG